MRELVLFVFGAIFGSFLNVISLRYDPDKFLLHSGVLRGRSQCPHCGKTLRWFELVPLLSFFLQGGRCRTCRCALTLQYPLVEALSGLIFVFVPVALQNPLLSAPPSVSVLWTAVFLGFLLIALIDLRLCIIPDELTAGIAAMGLAIAFLGAPLSGSVSGSFLGSYALMFGFRESIWANRLFAALAALAFFGFLVFVTRGRGMGMGDVKLVGALGLLFGWPDIALLVLLAFVLGAIAGIGSILRGKKTMKNALPFGPFLVSAAALVFFAGHDILDFYFWLFRFAP